MTKEIDSFLDQKSVAAAKDIGVDGLEGLLSIVEVSVPGASFFTKAARRMYSLHQFKRLEQFLTAAELDESYLHKISTDTATQEILFEFIENSLRTSPPQVIVALALIYRSNLPDSLKTLSASALGGISQGSLNVFMKTMEYAENRNIFDVNKLPVSISTSSAVLEKHPSEIFPFCSDLISRSICSKCDLIDDQGDGFGINHFTIVIYNHLKAAQERLKNHP